MDILGEDQNSLASLGVVFFANDLIRRLDEYSQSQQRPKELSTLCERAIIALHRLQRPEAVSNEASSGLMATADELATFVSSVKKTINPQSGEEANKFIDRIQKDLGKIKDQKVFSPDLQNRINDVVKFFQSVAEEGLANCRRKVSGEVTNAERIWQHYSMI